MHLPIDEDECGQLPPLENVLLWSMRAWVIGLVRKIPIEEHIREAFARLRMPDIIGLLDCFMSGLCHGARRTLNVDCICNRDISADEHVLLAIFALYQQERTKEASALLQSLLTLEAAHSAGYYARRLACVLMASGHFFLRRPCLPNGGNLPGLADGPKIWH